MKLGMRVGLGPGHSVLDRDRAPLPKTGYGHSAPTQFSAHICYRKIAGWIKMLLGRQVVLGPSDIMLDGEPAPILRQGGRAPLSRFGGLVMLSSQPS